MKASRYTWPSRSERTWNELALDQPEGVPGRHRNRPGAAIGQGSVEVLVEDPLVLDHVTVGVNHRIEFGRHLFL
jgi:hypothetical protein